MEISVGLILIKDNKILLVHPTNAPWTGKHSFPKGLIEMNENKKDCAIRETYEEIGIKIKKSDIKSASPDGVIKYKKKNNIYKKAYYYIVDVTKYNIPDIIDKNNLQLEEVDDARFYTIDDAKKVILNRLLPILDQIKK